MQLPRDNCTTAEMGEVAGHILYHESMEDLPVRWMILGPKKKKQMLLSVRIPTPDDTPEQRNACEKVLTGIGNKKQWKLKPHGQHSNFQMFTREKMKDSASKQLEKSLKNEFPVWLGVTLLAGQCINIAGRGVPVLSKPFLMSQVPGCEAVRSLNSSSKLVLQFPVATPTPTALVHDLPLGVRVLLSSVGHRRRSELLLTPDPSLVSAGSSSYVPVGLRKPEDTPSDPDPLKFRLSCDMASWVAVGGASCRVDTRSLIGRTSHMGTDPVYGVASSALYLGEDATFVILGNLTLFPRGQWVARGRYHLGGTSEQSAEQSDDSDSNSHWGDDFDSNNHWGDDSDSNSHWGDESDMVDADSDDGGKTLGGTHSQWKEYAEELKACLREDHIPMSARKYPGYVRRNLKLLDAIFGEIRNDPPQHYLDQIAADLVTTGKNAPAHMKSNNNDSSQQLAQQQQQSKSAASQRHKQLTPGKSRKSSKKQKSVASPAQQNAAASSSPKGLNLAIV